jgi:hypothetical protein
MFTKVHSQYSRQTEPHHSQRSTPAATGHPSAITVAHGEHHDPGQTPDHERHPVARRRRGRRVVEPRAGAHGPDGLVE